MIARTFLDGRVVLHCGDCLNVLATLPEASVDSVVCDPPYHLTSIVNRYSKTSMEREGSNEKRARERSDAMGRLVGGFMGKLWDGGDIAARIETWEAVLRVLKPGGHLIAFSGTRTYHRMVCAIEDAGFEIRDQIGWCFGSGFPKSHDVSKGIDRQAGAQRDKIAIGAPVKRMIPGADQNADGSWTKDNGRVYQPGKELPATAEAEQWNGWGTALKPAWEPIVLARKPLTTNPVAVRDIVECELRARGVEGVIAWTSSAKNAARSSRLNSSNRTQAPETGETSARHVGASETACTDEQIPHCTGPGSTNGSPPTVSERGNCAAAQTASSRRKSSLPMGQSAPAAERESPHSSPLTTSAEVAPSTESSSIKRSMLICDDEGSQKGSKSFAGIATGLTDSRAVAHISRNSDGTFEWPDDLPIHVPARSLTVAENVLQHGTGAINVDGCRVETSESLNGGAYAQNGARVAMAGDERTGAALGMFQPGKTTEKEFAQPVGRWPANIVHDGSEEVLAAFPDTQSGVLAAGTIRSTDNQIYGKDLRRAGDPATFRDAGGDSGSAARFFYTAKADAEDRLGSKHPTVKPLDLMQWLVRLVTPRKGIVLDPFAGTGTTGEAAWREGMNAILIEREEEYQADIARRMDLATQPEKRVAVAKSKNKTECVSDLPLFAGCKTS